MCLSVCLSITTFSRILLIFVSTMIAIIFVRYSLDLHVYKRDFFVKSSIQKLWCPSLTVTSTGAIVVLDYRIT